jgi:hypothetical protein
MRSATLTFVRPHSLQGVLGQCLIQTRSDASNTLDCRIRLNVDQLIVIGCERRIVSCDVRFLRRLRIQSIRLSRTTSVMPGEVSNLIGRVVNNYNCQWRWQYRTPDEVDELRRTLSYDQSLAHKNNLGVLGLLPCLHCLHHHIISSY